MKVFRVLVDSAVVPGKVTERTTDRTEITDEDIPF
jgi:hypothetical protein